MQTIVKQFQTLQEYTISVHENDKMVKTINYKGFGIFIILLVFVLSSSVSLAVTFYERPPLNTIWNMTVKDDKFLFERRQDGRLEEWLYIEPCVIYNNLKQPLKNIKKYNKNSIIKASTIKNKDFYEFSYEFNTTNKEKTKISSLCYEITNSSYKNKFNYSNGIISTHSLNIDFNDIKKMGFTIDFINNTLLVNNLTGKEWNLDPVVNFTAVSISSVKVLAMSDDMIVIAYADDTNGDVSFQVWNTTGILLVAETDVDITASGVDYTGVGLTALNSTHFVIGWYDQDAGDAVFAIYKTTGTLVSGPTIADNAIGASGASVSVAAFNQTHFVIAWGDAIDTDTTVAVYDSSSNLKYGPLDVDTATVNPMAVEVATFNASGYVVAWADDNDDTTFSIYNTTGAEKTKIYVLDDNADTSVSITVFNSTTFAIGYREIVDRDILLDVYLYNGSKKISTTTVDSDTLTEDSTVKVGTINQTHIVVSWYDKTDKDLTFAIYGSNGVADVAATDIEAWSASTTNAFRYHSVTRKEIATNIALCNQHWVIAYANTTTQAIWRAYNNTGLVWDGYCDSIIPPEPPANTCIWSGSGNFVVNVSDNCSVLNTSLGSNCLYVVGDRGYFEVKAGNIVHTKCFGRIPFNDDGSTDYSYIVRRNGISRD